MWLLQLNPVTDRFERLDLVARADSKEALDEFLKAQTVETYMDGQFRKNFKKDGPLEWYNPPDRDYCFFEESLAAVIQRVTENWNNGIMVLPQV